MPTWDAAVTSKWIGSSKSASGSVQDGSGCGSGSPRSKVVSAISAKALASILRASCKVSAQVMVRWEIQDFGMHALIEELIHRFVGQHSKSFLKLVEVIAKCASQSTVTAYTMCGLSARQGPSGSSEAYGPAAL